MNNSSPIVVGIENLEHVFSLVGADDLKRLATQAYAVKRQHFGDTMSLYAPLYISNFCENRCRYCGFQADWEISRKKLDEKQIASECEALSRVGLQSVLLLTGESRKHSPPENIRRAVEIAARYFPHIALEVYPLSEDEYKTMLLAGADGVTIYQETYDRARYDELHISGPKKDFIYRLKTPERCAAAGMRQISLGVLLGLSPWRADVISLFHHLRYLEKKYPGVEYSLSFPRLRKVDGDDSCYFPIGDQELLAVIAAARILFPRVGINLSTRENEQFRDMAVYAGVTRMSAGSSTSVGGYVGAKETAGQFSVSDTRSLADVREMLKSRAIDPVVTDWRAIAND